MGTRSPGLMAAADQPIRALAPQRAASLSEAVEPSTPSRRASAKTLPRARIPPSPLFQGLARCPRLADCCREGASVQNVSSFLGASNEMAAQSLEPAAREQTVRMEAGARPLGMAKDVELKRSSRRMGV